MPRGHNSQKKMDLKKIGIIFDFYLGLSHIVCIHIVCIHIVCIHIVCMVSMSHVIREWLVSVAVTMSSHAHSTPTPIDQK